MLAKVQQGLSVCAHSARGPHSNRNPHHLPIGRGPFALLADVVSAARA